jgi:hypothetical protein
MMRREASPMQQRRSHSFEPRPLAAVAALILVAPAALFFAAAVGRQLQPREYQPARALNAIVEGYLALPPALGVALILVAPAVALLLAALVVWRSLATDPDLARDLRRLGVALAPILRRPTFLLSLVVCGGAGVMLALLAIHAVVG